MTTTVRMLYTSNINWENVKELCVNNNYSLPSERVAYVIVEHVNGIFMVCVCVHVCKF